MTSHNFDVPYAERHLGEVAAMFTQRKTENGVEVSGHCPKCLGETSSAWQRGAPGSGTKGIFKRKPEEDPDVLATAVLFCECGYIHPNQPANPTFRGCGASWRVRKDNP